MPRFGARLYRYKANMTQALPCKDGSGNASGHYNLIAEDTADPVHAWMSEFPPRDQGSYSVSGIYDF